MRSLQEIGNDIKVRINTPNLERKTLSTPLEICSEMLTKCGITEAELTKARIFRNLNVNRISMGAGIGAGLIAYTITQIGSYIAENPEKAYLVGDKGFMLWENWDALYTIWHVGEAIGAENILSLLDSITDFTNLFGVDGWDLLHFFGNITDFPDVVLSGGLGFLATKTVRHIFDELNEDDKHKLEVCKRKLDELRACTILASQAAPAAVIRKKLQKLGDHHFAY